mmetsp:Transcript_48980/g.137105  ORF Transcript_48980/g.137105 Transcript_48980/m.137105 type:complete len:634 (-) Transcript_48980:524-2425(-)
MPRTALQDGCERQLHFRDAEALAQRGGELVEEDNGEGPPFHDELSAHVNFLSQPGGVLRRNDAGVYEQAAIAVFRKRGEIADAEHLQAEARVQDVDEGVHEPLRELVERHEVGPGLARDLQLRVRPDVAAEDAVRLKRPHGIEPFRADLPQVSQGDLAGLRVRKEVVDHVSRALHLRPEELGVLLQGVAERAQHLGPAGEADQGVRPGHLHTAGQRLVGDAAQRQGIHARPHGSVGGEEAIKEEVERGGGEALARAHGGPVRRMVAPLLARARVHEHRDRHQVNEAAGLLGLVASPACHDALDLLRIEVAEPRMRRHTEIGIAVTQRLLGSLHRLLEPPLVEREVLELPLLRQVEDPAALLANRRELPQLRGHEVAVDDVRVVAARDLRVELHLHAFLDVVLGQIHTLHDADAGAGDSLVLLVAHGAEPVDAPHAHPIEHVGHHRLEACVADACDLLGVVEVHLGPVAALLVHAGVVHSELHDLSEAPALLPEVDDDADTPALRALDRLPQGEDQVRPAAADVAAEHVGADALVVDAHDGLGLRVTKLPRIAEGVNGAATDRGNVCFDTRVKQAVVVGKLVQRMPKLAFSQIQAARERWKVPRVVHRALGCPNLATGQHDLAVPLQVFELRDV